MAIANWGHHGMAGGYGFGVFGMILGLLFFLMLFAGGAVLLVWLIKMSTNGGRQVSPPRGNALEVLKARYAKGEISKEEYTEMKKELSE